MRNLINNISFKTNDNKLVQMFGEKAEKIANKLDKQNNRNGGITTTQYRKFYDKVLELSEKAEGLSEEEFKTKILPFVKMIVSKVEYSKTRKHCGEDFVVLMKESIKKVNSFEELKNFKYFLEAIIGFMPKN